MVPASIKAPPGAFFLSVGLYSPYTYTITNQHYKDYMRVIELRRYKETAVVLESDLQQYIDDGWTIGLSDDHREHNKIDRYADLSTSLKDTVRYMDASSTYFGRLYKDDPRIVSMNLRTQITPGIVESARKANKLATKAITGSTVYNNGTKEIKSKVHPGEGWNVGCLVRDRSAQTGACSARLKGTTVYNDGLQNYRVHEGEQDPTWIKGMVPRKRK